MTRAKALTIDRPGRLAASALLSVAGAAWLYWLMAPRWAAAALGPICSHASAFLHCPACYAAASLIAVGAGLALMAQHSGRR